MRFARCYLAVVGVVTALLGVLYVFAPTLPTDASGFGEIPPEALTDLRATYGGFQVAIGLYLAWCSRHATRVRTGLILLCVLLPAIALSRVVGLVIDAEPTGLLVGVLTFEVALSGLSWVILRRTALTFRC